MDALADFVYIDVTAQDGQAAAAAGTPPGGGESTSNKEQDLEDQLMALGERWSVLCTWVEDRSSAIEVLREDLRQLEAQRLDISTVGRL